jgi:hypothetical protein
MSDHSVSGYRTRGIVFANTGPGASQRSAAAIASAPEEDLVFRGGRILPDVSFKTFYVGKVWAKPKLSDARRKLDLALAAAMSDSALNEIVGQYFTESPISTTAHPSAVLDVPIQDVFNKGDVHALAEQVFTSGALAAVDLNGCVINFVLPPGAVLSSDGGGKAQKKPAGHKKLPGTPEDEEQDSRHGLGGYHGSIHIQRPGNPVTVLYSVAVWSENDNGIAIPDWEPWENVCATLYHELNEARTDPDVEDAITTGNVQFVGWNSASGKEIGDEPIEEAGSDLRQVFKKIPIAAEPRTVPIQLMWSNRVNGPEAPGSDAVATAQASRPSRHAASSRVRP